MTRTSKTRKRMTAKYASDMGTRGLSLLRFSFPPPDAVLAKPTPQTPSPTQSALAMAPSAASRRGRCNQPAPHPEAAERAPGPAAVPRLPPPAGFARKLGHPAAATGGPAVERAGGPVTVPRPAAVERVKVPGAMPWLPPPAAFARRLDHSAAAAAFARKLDHPAAARRLRAQARPRSAEP